MIILTLCLLGNFACFLSSTNLFKINFLEKLFQEYIQIVKQFGSRSGPTLPDLGPNSLQRYQQTTLVGNELKQVLIQSCVIYRGL